MFKNNIYIPYIFVLTFLLLLVDNCLAQFQINSFETIQEDSTSQLDREALYFYKNYPGQYFNSDDFNTTKKYRITIYLKDNSIIDAHSQIYFSENKHFIISNSQKIYPENTTQIVVHFENRGYDFIGIPGDSCWFFRTNDSDNDPIWLYSFLPEDKRRFIVFAKEQGSSSNPILITKNAIKELN